MNAKMKNINHAEVLVLKDQISYQQGQVVSKTLAQNPAVSITLFSFDKGEEISTHESGGDAFVTCLTASAKLQSMASTTCSTKVNRLSCPPVIRMRCMVKKNSRCCLSSCFKKG